MLYGHAYNQSYEYSKYDQMFLFKFFVHIWNINT